MVCTLIIRKHHRKVAGKWVSSVSLLITLHIFLSNRAETGSCFQLPAVTLENRISSQQTAPEMFILFYTHCFPSIRLQNGEKYFLISNICTALCAALGVISCCLLFKYCRTCLARIFPVSMQFSTIYYDKNQNLDVANTCIIL